MSVTIRVFDPPPPCCGASADPDLARFAGDVAWLEGHGVRVERHDLSRHAAAFLTHAAVREALEAHGNDCLPLTLVDERLAVTGSYPSRDTLAALAGVVVRRLAVAPKTACCAPAAAPAQPPTDVREVVKERYGAAAKALQQGKKTSCCGGAAKDAPEIRGVDPITRDLYSAEQAAEVPADAIAASFGCGNPTALAELAAGEVVLDLGSGGGLDVLLSARRVGPTGKAYGLDMTTEMLELARANAAEAGAENVEFLQGTIESIPLPEGAIDVIISNCVVNLSSDKDQVFREAYRVLKPGGRLAISDLVLTREVPAEVRADVNLWTGCVAGSLLDTDLRAKLARAGFTAVEVEPTRVYDREDAAEMASASACCGTSKDQVIAALDGALMSAFIRAKKPAAS